MDASDLVARLTQHRTLGGAPRAELAWLVAHGSLRRIELGEFVSRTPELLESLVIVLSGHFAIHVDYGAGPRKVMEWGAGDASGALPYSRMNKPPGDAVIDEAGEVFLVHRDHFPEMIRDCPTVTTMLVHSMLDRARQFTSSGLQDEKMRSLGRQSARLAHELNNPASAAARSAKLLTRGLAELEDASRAVGAARLGEGQLAAIERSRRSCLASMASALSPIQRADREDEISAWLESHGADPGMAAALVETAVTFEDLDALASSFEGPALNTTLRWMGAACSTRALVAEIEKASTRVHELVAAVKRLSYMDQTSVSEPVDLAIGLNDSVLLLRDKARMKSAALDVTLPPDVPRVQAIGSDLGQIWTNLVGNALDAVPQGGHVRITAERRLDTVVVRILDDGPGIPPEITERIFEQFFTTKPVGQGTGLGLDIVSQLVRRNKGDIAFESRPGRTEFRVSLPVASDGAGPIPAA